jgi:hypothetical protein
MGKSRASVSELVEAAKAAEKFFKLWKEVSDSISKAERARQGLKRAYKKNRAPRKPKTVTD